MAKAYSNDLRCKLLTGYDRGQGSLRALAELLRQLREQPDRTLAELQRGLELSLAVTISTQHVWRVLKRLGVRLKKSHSTRLNETRKPIKSNGRSSVRKSTRPRSTS